MSKEFNKKFKEMIELSREVHKSIIKDSVCNVCEFCDDIDENRLERIVKSYNEVSPLNFITFRSWFLNKYENDEEKVKEKYKEIANIVLDRSIMKGLEELLLLSESYVIQIALNGIDFYNESVYGDCGCELSK